MGQSKGPKTQCLDHTGGTATCPPPTSTWETREKGVNDAAKNLWSKEPLLVISVTTGGDGRLAKGLKCHMTTRTNKDPVEQLDRPHLKTQSHRAKRLFLQEEIAC